MCGLILILRGVVFIGIGQRRVKVPSASEEIFCLLGHSTCVRGLLCVPPFQTDHHAHTSCGARRGSTVYTDRCRGWSQGRVWIRCVLVERETVRDFIRPRREGVPHAKQTSLYLVVCPTLFVRQHPTLRSHVTTTAHRWELKPFPCAPTPLHLSQGSETSSRLQHTSPTPRCADPRCLRPSAIRPRATFGWVVPTRDSVSFLPTATNRSRSLWEAVRSRGHVP